MKYINTKGVINGKTPMDTYPMIIIKDCDADLLKTFYKCSGGQIIEIDFDNTFYINQNKNSYWEDFLNDIYGEDEYIILDKFKDSDEYEITITRK